MSLTKRAIDAANAVSGAHPGLRALHARGTLLAGTFTATPEAAELTRAAHMQGPPVPVTARFSNGNGDPGSPDHSRDGRGLAVKMTLPDGSTTDIVSVSRPTFFVRTPEDFVELMEARRPDPESGQPDMERLGAFLGAHPESAVAIQAALAAEPPASYAQVTFHAIHAFRWVNADRAGRFVRYRWEPEAGVATLPDEEAAALGDDYLQREILERLEAGPVAFGLVLQLGEEDDPTDDSTQAWPDERETVRVGRLEITGVETEREQGDDILVFDPMRVTDGIEPSDDPILHFRSDAYAESVLRRSGVARS